MNNKLLFDYGPIWSKKCHDDEYMASRNVPPPDSITCGQMVTEDIFTCNSTEDHSVNDSAKWEKLKVKTRKYTSKKFPLNFDACATPFLNQPEYEQQFPGNVDKGYLNILSNYELNTVKHIVYGEFDGKSNVLKISSLKELDNENKGEIVLDNSQPISDYNVLHQVQADVINDIPYILLIVDGTVSFLKVEEEGFNLCCVESKDTTSSCLNKDLNNCFAFTGKGIVNLFDIDNEKVKWCCQWNKEKYTVQKYTQCEFGSNPFNICVSCESEIILADTRLESHKTRKIFDVVKFNTYLYSDKEIISSFKHTQDFPLFYVACTNTLLLMDERYCKYPVLNWYHMIKGRPSHIQCFKRNNVDFVLMADSKKSQFCFTSLQSDNSEYPDVVSLSTPIHKNIIMDTLLLAKQNKIAFSDLTEKQICSPLVGLSILPFSFGHTVVFQNNYGNLFYFNCYDRKNKHDFGSKEKALKHLKTFEKFVHKKIRKDHLKKCEKGKYLEGFKISGCFNGTNETIKKGKNWDKFIWNMASFNNYCSYSKFFSKNEINQRNQSDLSSFCEKDWENLSAGYIKNCSDLFSQKLLSSWSSNFSDFSSLDVPEYKGNFNNLFRYQSCPYFLDTEEAGEISMLDEEAKSETIPLANNLTNDLEDPESIPDSGVSNKSRKESLCLPDTEKNENILVSVQNENILDSSTNNSSRKSNLSLSDTKSENHLLDSSTNCNKRKSLCLSDKKKSKRKSRMDGF